MFSCSKRLWADRGHTDSPEQIQDMSFCFPLSATTRPNASSLRSHLSLPTTSRSAHHLHVAVRPPPPGFDYRSETSLDSRSVVEKEHPELMDLVEDGTLVVVNKTRFGPVPTWRSAFVEPEAIWLIGTSHVSERSAADVGRVVRAVRPDNVVVELCRGRAGIMYSSGDSEALPLLKSNMFSLSGSKFLDTIGRSINLGGQSALALRLLLAAFTSKISSGINRSFGDEFRSARKASEEVRAQIVLGDRPIEITLERAWSSLRWNDKLRFIFSLFRGITSQSIDMPESSLQAKENNVSPYQLYEQLSFSYPSLLQPLVYERDVYLAWSMKRSKAVNNCKTVVGVIGMGHMNGVVHALVSDQGNMRFRDLAGKGPSKEGSYNWSTVLFRGLVRDTILGIIVWVLFELWKTTS